jgi:hypothetical protein
MSERRFVRIHNKIIRLDSIAYVDFLDSGRAMIFVRGLTHEKQNITVDPDEAARLRAVLEAELGPDLPVTAAAAKFADSRRWF